MTESDLTLIECLGELFAKDFSPSKARRNMEDIVGNPIANEDLARAMFMTTYKKFMQCSEKERRSIARSDIEFIALIKARILEILLIRATGKPQDEEIEKRVFGKYWIPTPIESMPMLPRKNELMWLESCDPRPQPTKEDKQMYKILEIVFDAIDECYPEFSDVRNDFTNHFNRGTMRINDMLLKRKRGLEYYGELVAWFSFTVMVALVKFLPPNTMDKQTFERITHEVSVVVFKKMRQKGMIKGVKR